MCPVSSKKAKVSAGGKASAGVQDSKVRRNGIVGALPSHFKVPCAVCAFALHRHRAAPHVRCAGVIVPCREKELTKPQTLGGSKK